MIILIMMLTFYPDIFLQPNLPLYIPDYYCELCEIELPEFEIQICDCPICKKGEKICMKVEEEIKTYDISPAEPLTIETGLLK